MRLSSRARVITAVVAVAALCSIGATSALASDRSPTGHHHGSGGATATPIKHLVVIFDENVSFDHYFGTYPFAANQPGEPAFHARPGTPTVNGLYSDITSSGPVGPAEAVGLRWWAPRNTRTTATTTTSAATGASRERPTPSDEPRRRRRRSGSAAMAACNARSALRRASGRAATRRSTARCGVRPRVLPHPLPLTSSASRSDSPTRL